MNKKQKSHTSYPWISYLWIAILFFFSTWLMIHTFSYDPARHEILLATRLWSDFGANIPLIRSFSKGANIERMIHLSPPDYAIFTGQSIRKHFLFYAFVGLLERLGVRIDWALNIPSIAAFFALLLGISTLSLTLFHSKRVAVLSVLFFLFNGSLSFLKFFTQHPLGINTLVDISSLREFPSFAPWGPGDITAFWNLNIYTNQRHLALGFAIGVWFLVWAARSQKNQLGRAIGWGVLMGMLPYLHQPMLIVMAIEMLCAFLFFPKIRWSLAIMGIISVLLVAPQILTMAKNDAVSLYPGYFIHDSLILSRFLWYWFQNIGVHLVFICIGFWFLPSLAKRTLSPLFAIFLVANLFKFSPEVAANHKFFNFSLILGAMISAFVVGRLIEQCNKITIQQLRVPLKILVGAGLISVLTLSGIIDFFVVRNDPLGTVGDIPADPRAQWIVDNTPKDAVFLNSSFLYHPASLAGRSVFLGWPYFAWSEGYDTHTRLEEMKLLYQSSDRAQLCQTMTHYHIRYVTYQDKDTYYEIPFTNEAWYRDNSSLVFVNKDKSFRIYDTEGCQ